MKKKINTRLVGIAIMAVVATVISITIVYYGFFERQIRSDLEISAKLLKDTHYFESVNVDTDTIDLSTDMDELRVTWIGSDGTVLYDNDASPEELSNHANRPEIQEAFTKGSGESVRRSDTMNMNTFYYAILLDNGTVLRVATEAENIQSIFFAALPIILFITLVILVVCVIFSHLLTRQLIAPIETMAKNIEDMGATPPYRELVPFANMIRQQHTDILSAAKMRQDFTANVSHELKTPLTAISGYAELIQNHMVDEAQHDHFIAEIRKNTERLLSLINDIIRLSELDRNEDVEFYDVVDLYDVVSECIEGLEIAAERRNITLSFEGEHFNIHGNREMMRELVDNLVQNAIRYNNEGGTVWISVVGGVSPTLIVRDNGIGIPADEQERIFERFYRVDKSRSRETGGTGLGLAIVKHIVEIHHAKIQVNSTVGEGTEMKVTY